MSNENTKHENAAGHGSYERQDLRVPGILYFLLAIVVATVICLFGLKGLYAISRTSRKKFAARGGIVGRAWFRRIRGVSLRDIRRHVSSPKLEEDERAS